MSPLAGATCGKNMAVPRRTDERTPQVPAHGSRASTRRRCPPSGTVGGAAPFFALPDPGPVAAGADDGGADDCRDDGPEQQGARSRRTASAARAAAGAPGKRRTRPPVRSRPRCARSCRSDAAGTRRFHRARAYLDRPGGGRERRDGRQARAGPGAHAGTRQHAAAMGAGSILARAPGGRSGRNHRAFRRPGGARAHRADAQAGRPLGHRRGRRAGPSAR